jgi:uncharacterized membrane protein
MESDEVILSLVGVCLFYVAVFDLNFIAQRTRFISIHPNFKEMIVWNSMFGDNPNS